MPFLSGSHRLDFRHARGFDFATRYILGAFSGEFESWIPNFHLSHSVPISELSERKIIPVLVDNNPQNISIKKYNLYQEKEVGKLVIEPTFNRRIVRRIECDFSSERLSIQISTQVHGNIFSIFSKKSFRKNETAWLDTLSENILVMNPDIGKSNETSFCFGRDELL